MLSQSVDEPRHATIRKALLAEINTGRWLPGHQVPTEAALMERFKVSRTTVRRALRDLEMSGLVDRQPGRGSFVREPQLAPRLDRLTGFVEDMEELGLVASAKVVTIEKVPARADVAAQLQLEIGAPSVHIERIRLGNGQPISFDDSYFADELGSRVARENLETDPFYAIFEDKYEVGLSRADYVVAATVADPRIAGLLQIPVGSPVLQIDRTSCDSSGTPILFEHLHYRGDRIRYRLTLDR